jgi:hypothetical protein
MAPSAASGNEASTRRANSRTPRIEASAVSGYAWVCAPAASPMAVLLPLLLIGKPRSRPAPGQAAGPVGREFRDRPRDH